jgi:hypothetical protein
MTKKSDEITPDIDRIYYLDNLQNILKTINKIKKTKGIIFDNCILMFSDRSTI